MTPVTLVPPCEQAEPFQVAYTVWVDLWDLISRTCKVGLSDQQVKRAVLKSGVSISSPQAKQIANTLQSLLETGAIRPFIASCMLESPRMCPVCNGSGKAPPTSPELMRLDGSCKVCRGKGDVSGAEEQISESHVRNFVKFSLISCGFTIRLSKWRERPGREFRDMCREAFHYLADYGFVELPVDENPESVMIRFASSTTFICIRGAGYGTWTDLFFGPVGQDRRTIGDYGYNLFDLLAIRKPDARLRFFRKCTIFHPREARLQKDQKLQIQELAACLKQAGEDILRGDFSVLVKVEAEASKREETSL